MSEFTKGKWKVKYNPIIQGIFDEDNNPIQLNEANARLIAAAPEMYEMITKLVDGITIAELLNGMQVVKVNPVLLESAKRLLAEIDGEGKE